MWNTLCFYLTDITMTHKTISNSAAPEVTQLHKPASNNITKLISAGNFIRWLGIWCSVFILLVGGITYADTNQNNSVYFKQALNVRKGNTLITDQATENPRHTKVMFTEVYTTTHQSELDDGNNGISIGGITINNGRKMANKLDIPDELARFYVDKINKLFNLKNTNSHRRYLSFVDAVNIINYFVYEEDELSPKEGWYAMLRVIDYGKLRQYSELYQKASDAITKNEKLKAYFRKGNKHLKDVTYNGQSIIGQGKFMAFAEHESSKADE